LYRINPDGYAHNLSQAWKHHYKFRLGLCRSKSDGAAREEHRALNTECFLKALKFANRAIEINPNKADAYLAKGYLLASIHILNRSGDRAEEWGGLKKATEFAEKGFNLISRNSYQYGLAGEVFTLCNEFEKATNSFSKLFELDDNPTNTFTSFYMQSSFLNGNLDVMKTLAERIVSDRQAADEIDNCKSPFCGNAGFAYLFLLYAADEKQDSENREKYLSEYNLLENKYTKAMFTGRTNPANSIWPNEFGKIIKVMDTLGWHQ
jgi:tetratricopeptide (TPR) repeat protein